MIHLIKTLLVSCAVVTLVSACGQNGALFLENANTATPENNAQTLPTVTEPETAK